MKEVVTALGYTSNEVFEDYVGLGHGFVSRLTRNVRKSSLDKIVLKFPQVNATWIMTGRGEMFVKSKAGEVPVNTLPERLNKFRLYIGMSKSEFERKAGLFRGFFNRDSSTCFGPTLLKIKSGFPQLNIEWLVYGKGEMVVSGDDNVDVGTFTSYKDRIKVFCDYLGVSTVFFLKRCHLTRSMIKSLPDIPSENDMNLISEAYPNLNMDWIKYGKGEMLKPEAKLKLSQNISFIPLVPQMAYAGYLCGFEDEQYIQSLPTIPFLKEEKENYIAFEVNGDSMDDGSSRAYQDGDIVICKEIPTLVVKDGHLSFDKKEFVIVHSGGILIKQITQIDEKTGNMVLHSFNPAYNDLDVNLTDVRKIFSVEFQQKRRRR